MDTVYHFYMIKIILENL